MFVFSLHVCPVTHLFNKMLRPVPPKRPKSSVGLALPAVHAARASNSRGPGPAAPSDLGFSLPQVDKQAVKGSTAPPKRRRSSVSGLAPSPTGLTSTQLKALKRAFTWADANYDNNISIDELGELLVALGYKCSLPEVQELFKQLDSDNSGSLSLKEFQAGLGSHGAERVLARQGALGVPRRPSNASVIEQPQRCISPAFKVSDERLVAFFRDGHFTEKVDALFDAGITLDMLIEYSYFAPRFNALLDTNMSLTSEGKRRIRGMLCRARNARVLDSKNIAIVVHTRWYDDSLLWEHPFGGACAPTITDVLLAAGYTVHSIGAQDAPATKEAVKETISAIAATLPHRHKAFARKRITLMVYLVGAALEDRNGVLYLIPQDASLSDLPRTALPLSDIIKTMPWGVNVMLLADFGYVYNIDENGHLGVCEYGLGLMVRDNNLDDPKNRFPQPLGGGSFTFTASDMFQKSRGVSHASLHSQLHGILNESAALGVAMAGPGLEEAPVAAEDADLADHPEQDLVLTRKQVNYTENMKVTFDIGLLMEVPDVIDPQTWGEPTSGAKATGQAYVRTLQELARQQGDIKIALNDVVPDKPSVMFLELEGDYKQALHTGDILKSAGDLAQIVRSDHLTFCFKSPTLLQVDIGQRSTSKSKPASPKGNPKSLKKKEGKPKVEAKDPTPAAAYAQQMTALKRTIKKGDSYIGGLRIIDVRQAIFLNVALSGSLSTPSAAMSFTDMVQGGSVFWMVRHSQAQAPRAGVMADHMGGSDLLGALTHVIRSRHSNQISDIFKRAVAAIPKLMSPEHTLSNTAGIAVRTMEDLHQQLLRAQPGYVLDLWEGTYEGSVVLSATDITIRGFGAETVIISTSNHPAVTIKGSVTLQNLTIQGTTQTGPAVVIEQGKPELNQCMISCPGGGVEARAGTNPTLVDCTIQDCAYGTGIALDQCKGLIKTCAVTRCKIGMEIVGMESGVFMDHCSSTHNRGAGVVIEHGAAPKLQWCRFSYNKTHGVLVEDKASPILLHCVMEHNESHGLAVEASEVRVESCDFKANEGPKHTAEVLLAEPMGHAVLRQCNFTRGTENRHTDLAIRLQGSATSVTIELNDFFGYHTVLMNLSPDVKALNMLLNCCVMATAHDAGLVNDVARMASVRTGTEYNFCYSMQPEAVQLWGKNECRDLSKASFVDVIEDGYRALVTHFLRHEGRYDRTELGLCLMAAIRAENAGLARQLLEANADPDERGEFGWTPVQVAIHSHQNHILQMLIGHGADCRATLPKSGMTPAEVAVKTNNLDALSMLLTEGAVPINEHLPRGITLLHQVCRQGNLQAMRFLVGKDADVNAVSKSEAASILYDAVCAEALPVVTWLAQQNGINTEKKTVEGDTAVFCAVRRGNTEILKALMGINAGVCGKATNGATALHMAAEQGHLGVLQWLVSRRQQALDCKTQNALQRTALHLAVAQGHLDCVELLLSSGASRTVVDSKGLRPIDSANVGVAQAFYDTLELQFYTALSDSEQPTASEVLLKRYPQFAKLRLEGGHTPLLQAAIFCNRRAVSYLLEKQCDPMEQCDDGLTIAFWAMALRTDLFRGVFETWQIRATDKDSAAYDRIQKACNKDPLAQEIWQWGTEIGQIHQAAKSARVAQIPMTPYARYVAASNYALLRNRMGAIINAGTVVTEEAARDYKNLKANPKTSTQLSLTPNPPNRDLHSSGSPQRKTSRALPTINGGSNGGSKQRSMVQFLQQLPTSEPGAMDVLMWTARYVLIKRVIRGSRVPMHDHFLILMFTTESSLYFSILQYLQDQAALQAQTEAAEAEAAALALAQEQLDASRSSPVSRNPTPPPAAPSGPSAVYNLSVTPIPNPAPQRQPSAMNQSWSHSTTFGGVGAKELLVDWGFCLQKLEQTFNRMPVFSGTCYMVAPSITEPMVEGTHIVLPGFPVATKSMYVARSLLEDNPACHLAVPDNVQSPMSNVLLTVNAKNAVDVSACSAYHEHVEVLFRPDTMFEVVRVHHAHDATVRTLRKSIVDFIGEPGCLPDVIVELSEV